MPVINSYNLSNLCKRLILINHPMLHSPRLPYNRSQLAVAHNGAEKKIAKYVDDKSFLYIE